MEKIRTCFFTGHRRINKDKTDIIKSMLYKHIEDMIIRYDVKNFIAGGALGFDTLAAEAVIRMREKYPHIKLHLYLPCHGQEKYWTDLQKYRYRLIMSRADSYIYVTEGKYTNQCMMQRNKKMTDDSSFCIAFCILSSSGTGVTLRNAKSAGVKIYNIADEIYE